jgi:hypothetical protein
MAQGLRDLHSRLQGDILKAKGGGTPLVELGTAKAGAKAVAAVLALLGEPINPARDRPKRTNVRRSPVKPGVVPRAVLQELRLSRGWLSPQEMAGPILAKQGQSLEGIDHARIVKAIATACVRLEDQGHLVSEARPSADSPKRAWQLADRHQAVLNRSR